MATEIKKKAGRPATNTTTKIVNKVEKETPVETKTTETVTEKPITKTNQKVKIPADTLISCRSGVRGELRYISKRLNGMQYVWNDFGDENTIEFEELMSMRNTDLRFFTDNWVIIEDSDEFTAEEIYESLKVSQYYRAVLSIDNFDSIFNERPEKIIETISKMSTGLKDTIAIRAKQLYNSGTLDSRKCIEALEQALGIELIKKGN